jgi:hypothetical protein
VVARQAICGLVPLKPPSCVVVGIEIMSRHGLQGRLVVEVKMDTGDSL